MGLSRSEIPILKNSPVLSEGAIRLPFIHINGGCFSSFVVEQHLLPKPRCTLGL